MLSAITHSPGFESFGAEIARLTGLRAPSIYKLLARLAERGFVREARVEPARHGTPRRWFALTDAGRALAEQWGVMRRETVVAERLRAVAVVLDLGAGDPLFRVADLLDVPGVPGAEFDVDALVEAVLGSDDGP
ncbi:MULTISPECIES: PadR family transcriptional regulator [Amycolatopsis]|uniref:Helix-turn-helix transcriptional regulator n=1 Tax=Amycolatopsis echigonensis TaxID=2576905 RepID=A0A2N3WEU5_9PSEU|nr:MULTISPECIES: helix-turn-helix transcriptional regulator [Amycolatopsis]MBB2505410.1 helix-turn-helix transcriptional regulator [Amycolatopsis echigonensis]PKV92416.1 PadR family transcriptional regulator [Amycolatopsis niigatensis]